MIYKETLVAVADIFSEVFSQFDGELSKMV